MVEVQYRVAHLPSVAGQSIVIFTPWSPFAHSEIPEEYTSTATPLLVGFVDVMNGAGMCVCRTIRRSSWSVSGK